MPEAAQPWTTRGQGPSVGGRWWTVYSGTPASFYTASPSDADRDAWVDTMLLHGVRAARYWESGEEDSSFRYNNYLSRFHWRHLDLMDVIAGFQARGRASLADVAALLGLPGKLGFDGSQVYDAWKAGNITGIRRYCETDVLNTYLIHLSFERMRGRLDTAGWQAECRRVRMHLAESGEPHHAEFLQAWPETASQ